MNLDELRARYERDELKGEELVAALVTLFGFDRATAELIASGDFKTTEEDGITTIS